MSFLLLNNDREGTYDEDQTYGTENSRNNMNFEQNSYDTEEDTEEASETEFKNRHSNNDEPIKEQMYQDKLAGLKNQLVELKNFTHPDYVKRIKRLDYQRREHLRLNDIFRDYLRDCAERDYFIEKKAAVKEHEEKKIDLRENLMTDYEDKRKLIESERYTLELTSDSMEIKPTITRKLRRRPNEPMPVVEKRRKPPTGQLLVYMLDDKDIDNDLKSISRGKGSTPTIPQNGGMSGILGNQMGVLSEAVNMYVETRIEDGKLLYERRWYHRGQQVYVEGKDMSKFAATISAIGNEVVWVKKVHDNNKVKINMSQLAKGKIAIKRRAN